MAKTIEDYKKDWDAANARGDEEGKRIAHEGAEAIRMAQGYSGGADGSQYIPLKSSSSNKSSSSSSYQPTSVLMPDGNLVTGYIQNGVTYMPEGSRVPIGAKVQTGGGWYEMTDSGGVQIDTPNFTGGSSYMGDMSSYIRQQQQAYLQQQQARLASERDRQIAELEQIYERQLAEGKISIRQAQAELEEQKKQIEKDYYQAEQKLDLYAYQMGIQNSQQLVGLRQGEQYRKGQLNLDATNKYNQRVADIRDRINNLLREKSIGIANVNAQYNAGVIGAIGEANMNAANQMIGLRQQEYQNEVQKNQAIEMALLQSKLRIDEMVKQGEITQEQARIAFEMEKEKLALQYGYDVSLMNARNTGATDDYQTTLLRLAESYGIDPNNLPEGAKSLAHAITLYEKDAREEEKWKDIVTKLTAEDVVNNAKEIVSQGQPKLSSLYPFLTPQKQIEELKQYKARMEAYSRAYNALNPGAKMNVDIDEELKRVENNKIPYILNPSIQGGI